MSAVAVDRDSLRRERGQWDRFQADWITWLEQHDQPEAATKLARGLQHGCGVCPSCGETAYWPSDELPFCTGAEDCSPEQILAALSGPPAC